MISVGIILTPDARSKAYIQKLTQNHIILDEIIFMNDEREEKIYSNDVIDESKRHGFDIAKSVKNTLCEEKLKFKEFNFVDINHPDLVSFVKYSKTNFFIFTGGGILRKEILNTDKKFVHLHPGIVPQYRGSTCFYYSMIKEDKCGVTAYIMNEGIDAGKVIYQKIFLKPTYAWIDDVYDPHIRSETLLEVLRNNLLEKCDYKNQSSEGETYFIIHPVLKHIATLSCLESTD